MIFVLTLRKNYKIYGIICEEHQILYIIPQSMQAWWWAPVSMAEGIWNRS